MHRSLKEDLQAALQDPSNTLIIVGTGVSIGATRNERCASWRGLIEDGIHFCLTKGLASPEWADLRRRQLASGDLNELLGAAEALQRTLGGEQGGDYSRWLEDSVGRLRLSVHDVVDALVNFDGPLATTNYDGLLEEATGREAVTWRQSAEVERVLRRDKKAILHLHGYWKEPESVILSIRDYERILKAEGAQALQGALGFLRTIVFVGCGGEGLSDPNFGPMLEWVLRVFRDSRFHHYLVVRSREAVELEKKYSSTGKLRVISYGDDFGNLGPFLREVIPQRNLAAAGVAGGVPNTTAGAQVPPPQLPVRPTRCIGRDDVIKDLIATLLQAKVPPTPVLGPAGIGKSTVTLSALHDDQVAQRFGIRRFFVRSDASHDAEALLTQIALELQLPPGASLQERLFAELDRAQALLVLDNLETPWEQDSPAVEELLVRLAALPRVALVCSLRGKSRPAGPEWRDPPFELDPLGRADSRRVFLALAGQKFAGDPRLEDFLTALEGVPLAIELLAYFCQAEPDLEGVWSLWEQKRTEILKRRGRVKDRQSSPRQESLEASYELSLASPRMTKHALRLFKLLGCLPLGLAHSDLWKLPITMEPVEAAMTLRQLGLAFDEAGRLRMLAPLREYANRRYPPSANDRDLITDYYFQIALQECARIGTAESKNALQRLSVEVGNLESVFELGLRRKDPRPAIEVILKTWETFILSSGLGTARPLKRALNTIREFKDIKSEARCLYSLGRIASFRSHPQSAEDYFQRALILSRRSKHLQGQAHCIYSLGEVYAHRSWGKKAVACFKESLELYRQTGALQGQANSILGLAQVAIRRSQWDEALSHVTEALTLYRQSKSFLGQGNCLLSLGDISSHRSHLDKAVTQFKAALELYGQTESRLGQANCTYSLGKVALLRLNLNEAATKFKDALELYRQLNEIQGQANSIEGLGNVAIRRSQLGEATAHIKAALELFRQTEDPQGQANCIGGLGLIAFQRSHLNDANSMFKEALELYRQIENPQGQANCIHNLAAVALERSQLDEAATQLGTALDLYRQIDSLAGQADCLQSMGEVALEESRLDAAVTRFNEALSYYRQLQILEEQANCIRGLGEVALRRGQPDEARKLFLEALEQFERLPNLLSIGKIHQSLARLASDVATRRRHVDLAVTAWRHLENRLLIDRIQKEFGESEETPS